MILKTGLEESQCNHCIIWSKINTHRKLSKRERWKVITVRKRNKCSLCRGTGDEGWYLMEGRCRVMTSRAWTESSGTSLRWPERASSSIWRLTTEIHCSDTLNVWSFPSPGRVTSRSTWRWQNGTKDSRESQKVEKEINHVWKDWRKKTGMIKYSKAK